MKCSEVYPKFDLGLADMAREGLRKVAEGEPLS